MPQVDLTHTFKAQMPHYPGDKPSHICQTMSIEKDGCTDQELCTGMHIGTHMDAPAHMIPEGKKICEYDISKFSGRGVLIDARGKNKVDETLLEDVELREGDIVIVDTNNYKKFHDEDYYKGWPAITQEFAKHLVGAKVAILGVDVPSPDLLEDTSFPIHNILLPNDILIIENLNNLAPLHQLGEFTITALPLKIEADASPTRVLAKST